MTIVDECGEPISGAVVEGTFAGDFNETVSVTTDGSGVAVLVTDDTKKGSIAFTFCVDDVTHASLSYAGIDNVETCDNNF